MRTIVDVVNKIIDEYSGHWIKFQTIREDNVRVRIDDNLYRISDNFLVEEIEPCCLVRNNKAKELEERLKNNK